MATLSNLITDVRSKIVEPVANYFADSELTTWLNQAYAAFAAETFWFEKIAVISPVPFQEEYYLPADYLMSNQLMWDDRWPVADYDMEQFRRYVSTANFTKSIRPFIYTLYPWNQKIRVYPIPNTAITDILGANVLVGDTTITLTVNPTLFPARGRVLIDSEQIYYTGTSGNQLTGCVRGDMYTTAAAHTSGATVYDGRMWLYYSYMPPALATASPGPQVDSRTGPLFDEALVAHAVSQALTKRDRYSQASYYRKLYDAIVLKAKEHKAQRDRDRGWAVNDDYPEWLM